MITQEAKDDFTKRLNDEETLWLTVFGEARGEPIESQVGVASVILNRSIEQNKTIKEICLAKLQFSCWNRNDPNLEQIFVAFLGPSRYLINAIKQVKLVSSGVYYLNIQDNTKGSNHYLTNSLYRSANCPKWAKDKNAKLNVVLGSHTFIWCP